MKVTLLLLLSLISFRRIQIKVSLKYVVENKIVYYTRLFSHLNFDYFLDNEPIHILWISDRSKQKSRPSFSTQGLDKNISSFYKTSQNDEWLFGNNDSLSHKLLKNSSSPYLAKGHLSPDADFILATAQYTTYHYINIALQWYKVLLIRYTYIWTP